MTADLKAIEKTIAQGETDTLEFKKSTAQLEAVAETLSAFANHKGGKVIIGVSDSGEISGQHVSDSTRREIAQMLKKFEPPIHAHSQYIDIGSGKSLIVLEVSHDLAKVPVAYQGRSYTRMESTNSLMPQSRYRELLVRQKGPTWEELLATDYGIKDLDKDEIQKAILQAVEANRIPSQAINERLEDVLSRLKLMNDGHLTQAAVVLFALDPFPRYSQCLIRMARFMGTDMACDFLDNKRIHGNAFKLLEAAQAFLATHLPIASFYQQDKFERIDKPTLPVMAVREALINAICHRDYTDRSASLSLAV